MRSDDSDEAFGGGFHLVALPNAPTVGLFRALEEAGLPHAVTTRRGFDVARARTDHEFTAGQLAATLGLNAAAWLEQVHGSDILSVAAGGLAGEGDGMVTATPLLGLAGRSADCPLILIADPGAAVGMAHASWRGVVGRIAERLVDALVAGFGADRRQLVGCVCPSAGACCYEVGRDVLEAALAGIGPHAEAFFARRGDKMYFDLWSANSDQLLRAGLDRRNIHVAAVCTMCRNDLFPSHRLEGARAGRFVAAIARR
jgi:hypothetical protein